MPEAEPQFETAPPMAHLSRTEQILSVLLLAAFPLVGLATAGLGLWGLWDSLVQGYARPVSTLFYCLTFGGCAGFCLYLGWCILARALARFRFLEEGLAVTFPLREEILIPWDAFQQVCVCYPGCPTRGFFSPGPGYLCCVKKGEKKNIYGRWKDSDFHYRTVLMIGYRPEYLAAIRQVCPFRVPDLRGIGNYRP